MTCDSKINLFKNEHIRHDEDLKKKQKAQNPPKTHNNNTVNEKDELHELHEPHQTSRRVISSCFS